MDGYSLWIYSLSGGLFQSLLAAILEVYVSNSAICSGNFYQGLLGCDVLCGYNKDITVATTILAGLD